MTLTVTPLYAGALAILFFILSLRVVQGRSGPGKPSLGDGGDPLMQRRIRGHANFAEYVPLILVLMALLELGHEPTWILHALGGALLLARLLHGIAFAFTAQWVVGRSVGAVLTFLCLLVAGVLSLWLGLHGGVAG